MKLRKNLNISCTECGVGHLCLRRNLTLDILNLLDQKLQYIKTFQSNEHMYLQGDKVTSIYAIYSGVCKDYNTYENGDFQINEFYFPGDILGLEYLDKEIFQLNAMAIKETTVCVIPINLFKNTDSFIQVKNRLLQILCQQIENYRHYSIQTNVKCRVAAFFLNFIRRTRERQTSDINQFLHITDRDIITIPMTHIDISSKIGISNETLSRILKEFVEDNVFKVQHNMLFDIDIQRLQNILHSKTETLIK